MRAVPATTPNRRLAGNLRPKSSNTERLCAMPLFKVASIMVNSYMSVNSDVTGDAVIGLVYFQRRHTAPKKRFLRPSQLRRLICQYFGLKTIYPSGMSFSSPSRSQSGRTCARWLVRIWEDPVTLDPYLTRVLIKQFGLTRGVAMQKVDQLHRHGSISVATCPRERAEAIAAALHEYGIGATVAADGDS